MDHKIFFNSPWMKQRRRDLRSKSTLAERVLWERLRDRKLGWKFLRQYSVEGYVIDFYCPDKRLGIELEGKIHDTEPVKKYDEYRKKFLEAFGIKILTIRNGDVLGKIKDVLMKIDVSLS